jgi:hypothetical protein
MKINTTQIDNQIEEILASPSIHSLTKDILRQGIQRDCVDAYFDTLLAAELLGARMANRLAGCGAPMPAPFPYEVVLK